LAQSFSYLEVFTNVIINLNGNTTTKNEVINLNASLIRKTFHLDTRTCDAIMSYGSPNESLLVSILLDKEHARAQKLANLKFLMLRNTMRNNGISIIQTEITNGLIFIEKNKLVTEKDV
jgi:hypothetical protein